MTDPLRLACEFIAEDMEGCPVEIECLKNDCVDCLVAYFEAKAKEATANE
jgi:hypothetical protein